MKAAESGLFCMKRGIYGIKVDIVPKYIVEEYEEGRRECISC